jgi:CO/xanthine dehydrogenase FAD-binding subunit
VVTAPDAAAVLQEQPLDDVLIQQAADACSQAARPIDDIRSSADYRKQVVGALLTEGLLELRDHLRYLESRRHRRNRRKS